MKTECCITLPGQELVWNMAPGRTAALKLQNEQTGQSVMAFEEVTPAGTETPLHLHHDSDENNVRFERPVHFQGGRSSQFRRAGYLRIHATRHTTRLEEQWS